MFKYYEFLPRRTCEQTSHGVIFLYVYSWKLWASESPPPRIASLVAPFLLKYKPHFNPRGEITYKPDSNLSVYKDV